MHSMLCSCKCQTSSLPSIILFNLYLFFNRTSCTCTGLLLHLVTLNDTHTYTVGLPEQGMGLPQNCLSENTWHSHQTDIHASGAIETCNPNKRVAADLSLRPCGH